MVTTRTPVTLTLLIAFGLALVAAVGGDSGTSTTPLIVTVIDKGSPNLPPLAAALSDLSFVETIDKSTPMLLVTGPAAALRPPVAWFSGDGFGRLHAASFRFCSGRVAPQNGHDRHQAMTLAPQPHHQLRPVALQVAALISLFSLFSRSVEPLIGPVSAALRCRARSA